MTENSESPVLEILRQMQKEMVELKSQMTALEQRMSGLEQHLGGLPSSLPDHSGQLDRLERLISHIEHRLDLHEPSHQFE